MRCVAVDGEAIQPYGYALLCSSSGRVLARGQRLTSRECFSFLVSTDADRIFGYGIGYDVCHWVADLTDDEKTRLATRGRCYTRQGPYFYRLIYRPQAYFTVQRLRGLPGSEVTDTATVVDLMRWHRKPMVETCAEWGCFHNGEAEFVSAMKGARRNLRNTHATEEYCALECVAVADLGQQMVTALQELGIPASHPLTAGSVAGALMARNGVQLSWQPPPKEVEDAVTRAFFGGREQCSRYGHFRDVTQWDIRSAYGWAMMQLPAMQGRWHRMIHDEEMSGWTLFKVQWDIDEGRHPVMPFPWRDANGRVHYPPRGTGWQWSPIVRSALRHYPGANIRITDAWHFVPSVGGTSPFQYLGSLFNARREAGINPVGGLVKSIIVATWGRLCSPGTRGSKTRGMLDWAGMTTALIQERILDAIHTTGEHAFISACVDGFWTARTDTLLEEGEEIGLWSRSDAEELLLLGPTRYWKREGGDNPRGVRWEARTSGIPSGEGLVGAALHQWREVGWKRGRIDFALSRCKGLLACARDGDYSQLGQFVDLDVSVAFNPGQGRSGHECPTQKPEDGWRRWLAYWPPVSHVGMESHPFASRSQSTVDSRWTEKQDAEAIEETED